MASLLARTYAWSIWHTLLVCHGMAHTLSQELNDDEVEGFLFDIDGTLVDTMPHFYPSWIVACEQHGLTITEVRKCGAHLSHADDMFANAAPLPRVNLTCPLQTKRHPSSHDLACLARGHHPPSSPCRLTERRAGSTMLQDEFYGFSGLPLPVIVAKLWQAQKGGDPPTGFIELFLKTKVDAHHEHEVRQHCVHHYP